MGRFLVGFQMDLPNKAHWGVLYMCWRGWFMNAELEWLVDCDIASM